MLFFVAWFFVKRAIKEHLVGIETTLKIVATSVTELKDSMIKLETNHAQRLTMLEGIVGQLTHKVTQLSNNKED